MLSFIYSGQGDMEEEEEEEEQEEEEEGAHMEANMDGAGDGMNVGDQGESYEGMDVESHVNGS